MLRNEEVSGMDARAGIDWKEYCELIARIADPECEESLLTAALSCRLPSVMAAMASHRRTPPGVPFHLSVMPYRCVHWALAANPSASGEALERLFLLWGDAAVARILARNPATPRTLYPPLMALLPHWWRFDAHALPREYIASRASFAHPSYGQRKLNGLRRPRDLAEAVRNPRASVAFLAWAARMQDAHIEQCRPLRREEAVDSLRLAGRERVLRWILRQRQWSPMEWLARGEESDPGHAPIVAEHPRTPPDVLVELFGRMASGDESPLGKLDPRVPLEVARAKGWLKRHPHACMSPGFVPDHAHQNCPDRARMKGGLDGWCHAAARTGDPAVFLEAVSRGGLPAIIAGIDDPVAPDEWIGRMLDGTSREIRRHAQEIWDARIVRTARTPGAWVRRIEDSGVSRRVVFAHPWTPEDPILEWKPRGHEWRQVLGRPILSDRLRRVAYASRQGRDPMRGGLRARLRSAIRMLGLGRS
jgi:hypothetical protein